MVSSRHVLSIIWGLQMRRFLLSFALTCSVVSGSAQSNVKIDTLIPVARVLRTPGIHRSIPEFEGYRRPWVYLLAKYDTASGVRTDDRVWRFTTTQDTVSVYAQRIPNRTLFDANGDGYRDFYDTLLVLGTGSGWQADTLSLGQGHERRTVSDLNADGYADLILHYYGDSVRVYWGDSVLPLRESSLIINPDPGESPSWTSDLGIDLVDRLQGTATIMTSYVFDLGDGGQPRDPFHIWSCWKLNAADVTQRDDTIRTGALYWKYTMRRANWVGPQPVLNRGAAWVGMRYGEWIAFDTTGAQVREQNARDTLVLGASPILASLLLPLNHPPTLDSTLVLHVSDQNVLSVSEWLAPDQMIPSETRAYYLTPQTVNTTKIVEMVIWPDMTGDSIPELGVYREPADTLISRLDYCFEIYDIANATVSSVVMPRGDHQDADVTFRNGRVHWSTATGDRVSVRIYDATGRLLEAMTATTSELTSTGIDLGNRGRGLRLVELVDGVGNVRRVTVVVR